MIFGKDFEPRDSARGARSARREILHRLKLDGPRSATQLSEASGFTYVAIKKQLGVLEAEGLVEGREGPPSVGRPCRVWELTPLGNGCFHDAHGEMLARVVLGVREVYGEEGLRRVLARVLDCSLGKQLLGPYRDRPLRERLALLAKLRGGQGYMPEVVEHPGGSFTFAENHCPVARLASSSEQVCACELQIFREFLDQADVVRTEHLVAGDRRCAYAVTPRELPV